MHLDGSLFGFVTLSACENPDYASLQQSRIRNPPLRFASFEWKRQGIVCKWAPAREEQIFDINYIKLENIMKNTLLVQWPW